MAAWSKDSKSVQIAQELGDGWEFLSNFAKAGLVRYATDRLQTVRQQESELRRNPRISDVLILGEAYRSNGQPLESHVAIYIKKR